MATTAKDFIGNGMRYLGEAAADNAEVIQTDDVSRYDTFMLMSTDGAMDVFVSLDGTNYTTAALSLIDLGATTTDPVVVTAADRMYAFFGTYAKIQILQNGATAVTDAVLVCSQG